MKVLDCGAVRRRLQPFHDDELPVEDHFAVETHLDWCRSCAAGAEELRRLSEVLHTAASVRKGPADAVDALSVSVVSRLEAEREESLPCRLGRMFEDLHFVWAALGATATAFSVVVMAGLLPFTVPERSDSLSGILTALATPGSNENPVRLDYRLRLPSVDPDGLMRVMLETPSGDDMLCALAAVVTREGQVTDLEILLPNESDREAARNLLATAANARFQPAFYGNSPVAVNLVWLLARTTVRAKILS